MKRYLVIFRDKERRIVQFSATHGYTFEHAIARARAALIGDAIRQIVYVEVSPR